MTQARPSWDAFFLDVCDAAAKRTTCTRALETYGGIGACLVESASHHILGVGYCGSLPGQPHCTEVGCDIAPQGGCQRTLHGEMNAILFARQSHLAKTLYCNVSPCLKCLQHALAVGTTRVAFRQLYRMHDAQVALCEAAGVAWVYLPADARSAS